MNAAVPPSRYHARYYGWIIVAACTVILIATFGICYSFSVFFSSLQAEFLWSRARTSSIFSLYLIFAGFFSIIAGQALDRLGPRIVVVVMGAVTAVSLVLISRIEAVWQLYLCYSVLLALGTGPMYIIVIGTASGWFAKKRGTVVGIIGCGAGLGTVIFSPFSAWLIAVYNWRQAYLIIGLVAILLIIPPALLLKRAVAATVRDNGYRSPRILDPGGSAPVGSDPDGLNMEGSGPHGPDRNMALPSSAHFMLREVISTAPFRLIFIIWFCYSFSLHLVMGHIVPGAEDLGMDSLRAAAVLSVLTACTIPSRLISGVISDLVDKRRLFVWLALAHIVMLGWLAFADRPWMFFFFAALYGAAYGAIDPPIVSLVGDVFGLSQLGSIMGIFMVAWGLGSASGPYFGGLVFDIWGGYAPAFISAGLLMGLAVVCGYRLKAHPPRSLSGSTNG